MPYIDSVSYLVWQYLPFNWYTWIISHISIVMNISGCKWTILWLVFYLFCFTFFVSFFCLFWASFKYAFDILFSLPVYFSPSILGFPTFHTWSNSAGETVCCRSSNAHFLFLFYIPLVPSFLLHHFPLPEEAFGHSFRVVLLAVNSVSIHLERSYIICFLMGLLQPCALSVSIVCIVKSVSEPGPLAGLPAISPVRAVVMTLSGCF